MKVTQVAHPITYRHALLLPEDHPGMFRVLLRQDQKVGVARAQHTSHFGCPLQVYAVLVAKSFQAVGGYHVQARQRELFADRQIDTFIEVKARFSQVAPTSPAFPVQSLPGWPFPDRGAILRRSLACACSNTPGQRGPAQR